MRDNQYDITLRWVKAMIIQQKKNSVKGFTGTIMRKTEDPYSDIDSDSRQRSKNAKTGKAKLHKLYCEDQNILRIKKI